MKSKTLWLNKELILQMIRSVGWVSIVYFLGLFFVLPLKMLMMYSDNKVAKYDPIINLFNYDFPIQLGLIIVIPVLMSVFLFRFLQVKQAADLLHSLPIRREKIFHHYVLSGIVGLVLPVVFIAVIIMLIHSSLDLESIFGIQDILSWAGTIILLNLLLFTAGVFVAMLTGISVVQGVLTYIFLLFPAGITLLLFTNLNHLVFGFPGDYYLNLNLTKMSPITNVSILDGKTLQLEEVIIYSALAIILYVLSLFLYKKRKIESASEAIAFSKLRSVFKYGVTFCSMLLSGAYFSEVQSSNSFAWLIFGYVIGTVFGYYIAEMVLQKSWRVFSIVKGLFIYSGIIAVLFIGVQTLGIYEKNIPNQAEIKNVLLTDSPHVYMDEKAFGHVFTPLPLKSDENIKVVRKLHKEIINNKNEPIPENYEMAFFLYELNNGQKVIRQYKINRNEYEAYYKLIHESKEYKVASNEIFHIDLNEVKNINITANGTMQKRVSLYKRNDLEEFTKELQSDILAETYADSMYFQNGWGSSIEFIGKGEDEFSSYNLLKPTYKHAQKWLEEKGLLEQAKVTPDDISSIKVVKYDSSMDTLNPDEILKNSSNVLVVKDKSQIEEVVNNVGGWRNNAYAIVIRYKYDNYSEQLFMDEKHAPNFIKYYFK